MGRALFSIEFESKYWNDINKNLIQSTIIPLEGLIPINFELQSKETIYKAEKFICSWAINWSSYFKVIINEIKQLLIERNESDDYFVIGKYANYQTKQKLNFTFYKKVSLSYSCSNNV